jgi:hypothetical protein
MNAPLPDLIHPYHLASLMLQVWRPLTGPVWDCPLALCDAATLNLQDLVPCDIIYTNRVGETYFALHNEDHRCG